MKIKNKKISKWYEYLKQPPKNERELITLLEDIDTSCHPNKIDKIIEARDLIYRVIAEEVTKRWQKDKKATKQIEEWIWKEIYAPFNRFLWGVLHDVRHKATKKKYL